MKFYPRPSVANLFRGFAIFVVTSTVAACAAISYYQAPKTGPIASLTIKTFADEYVNIGVVSYTGNTYLESKGDVVGILNSRAIGYAFKDEISIDVQADKEFRFSTKVGDVAVKRASVTELEFTFHACQTHGSFIPRANLRYLAEHRVGPGICKVDLYVINPDGSRILAPTYRKLKTCLDPWLTSKAFKEGLCPPDGFDFR